jgi:hypothetical protein
MSQYKVFVNSQGITESVNIYPYKIFVNSKGITEAVKQGWSWPGFVFTWIWALTKQLWVIAVLALPVLLVLLPLLASATSRMTGEGSQFLSEVTILIWVIVKAVFGVKGNSWREKNLVSRGFTHVATVTAESPPVAVGLHLAPQS